VFFIFAAIYLGEKPTLKTGVAAILLIGAVVIAFWDDGKVN
jgi:drug/metabolite transporter (DMT)-like permease